MYNYAEYDSHHFIKNLTQHNMPEAQAEAIVKNMIAMRNYELNLLANKSDITSINNQIEHLKYLLTQLELRMIIKLGAMITAIATIAVTIVKIIF